MRTNVLVYAERAQISPETPKSATNGGTMRRIISSSRELFVALMNSFLELLVVRVMIFVE